MCLVDVARRLPGCANGNDVDIVFEQSGDEVDLGLAIGAQIFGELELEAPLLGRDEVGVPGILSFAVEKDAGEELVKLSWPTRRIASRCDTFRSSAPSTTSKRRWRKA